jgi:hypothetical protein
MARYDNMLVWYLYIFTKEYMLACTHACIYEKLCLDLGALQVLNS